MRRANSDIRELLAKERIYQWEVAHELGMKESNFTAMLRTELDDEKKVQIFKTVKKIKQRNSSNI